MPIYLVDVLDQQSLAFFIDLSNFLNLALVTTTNHTDSITRCEQDVLPAEVVWDSRRMHKSSIKRSIGRSCQPTVALGSQVALLPILPASLPSLLESSAQSPVVFLSRSRTVLPARHLLLLLGPEHLLLGLLPGRSRPLNDLLHFGVDVGQQLLIRCNC